MTNVKTRLTPDFRFQITDISLLTDIATSRIIEQVDGFSWHFRYVQEIFRANFYLRLDTFHGTSSSVWPRRQFRWPVSVRPRTQFTTLSRLYCWSWRCCRSRCWSRGFTSGFRELEQQFQCRSICVSNCGSRADTPTMFAISIAKGFCHPFVRLVTTDIIITCIIGFLKNAPSNRNFVCVRRISVQRRCLCDGQQLAFKVFSSKATA